MRELTYVAPKKLEWRERPDPSVWSRFDAVVRPVAATTCDVDKAIILEHSPVPAPFAIGHECVAEVVELGDGVTHPSPATSSSCRGTSAVGAATSAAPASTRIDR